MRTDNFNASASVNTQLAPKTSGSVGVTYFTFNTPGGSNIGNAVHDERVCQCLPHLLGRDMYETFFGLTGKPFQLNPDPAFFYGSRGHKRAFAYLQYGVHQGEGFIIITGEVGAGKTTLVRSLLDQLDPNRLVAAQLVTTQLDPEDLLRAVAHGVRVGNQGDGQGASARRARSVPRVARAAGQARAADRRRGPESLEPRDRRAADAIQLPARQPGAPAELSGGPARAARS